MAKKDAKRKRPAKLRKPKVRIPLPFKQAVNGLLGLSPEDAKAVRDAGTRK